MGRILSTSSEISINGNKDCKNPTKHVHTASRYGVVARSCRSFLCSGFSSSSRTSGTMNPLKNDLVTNRRRSAGPLTTRPRCVLEARRGRKEQFSVVQKKSHRQIHPAKDYERSCTALLTQQLRHLAGAALCCPKGWNSSPENYSVCSAANNEPHQAAPAEQE